MTTFNRNNKPDLTRYRALLFDADGTLRETTVPGQVCPNKEGEWRLKEGVKECIQSLPKNLGYAIISNQGGVAKGKLTLATAYSLLIDMNKEIWPKEALPYLFVCHHDSKGNCICRKPSPYMLLVAADAIEGAQGGKEIQRHQVMFVGDMRTDEQAAEAAGVDFMYAEEFFAAYKPA